jgi:methyl-accepting chemotaxis protein
MMMNAVNQADFGREQDYATGIAALDSDHRQLTHLIARADRPWSGYKDLRLLCDEVVEYVKLHFRREESLLAVCNYPDLAAHKAEHAAFEARLGSFMAGLGPETTATASAELATLLRDWFDGHVRGSDQACVPHLRRKLRVGLLGRLRVARLVPALIALVAVPLVALAAVALVHAVHGMREAALSTRANLVVDDAIALVRQVQEERDLTVAALTDPGNRKPQGLRARRAATDHAYRTFVAAMGAMAQSPAVAKQMAAAYTALQADRSAVDTGLTQPLSARPWSMVGDWLSATDGLVDAATQGRQTLVLGAVGGPLGTLIQAKHNAGIVDELIGRERLKIAKILKAGAAVTPADLPPLVELAGRMANAWQTVYSGRAAGVYSPAVDTALAKARQALAKLDSMRRTVWASANDGMPPFVDAKDWVAGSRGASDAVIAAVTALGRQADVTAAVQRHAAATSLAVTLALGLLGIGAALYAFAVMVRRVAGPMDRLTGAMSALAGGDIDASFATRYPDELGVLAEAFLRFKEAFVRNRHEKLIKELEADEQAACRRRADTLAERFEEAMRSVLATMDGAVDTLHRSADSMSANARETDGRTATVLTATEQANDNIQTVARAGGELRSSIQEISGQVSRSADVAQSAAAEAHAVDSRIGRLAEAVGRIGEIVELINGIAAQTNLLALNATIEAARAGEAGKGFAVVAGEVKGLATQTAKATEEIASQIAGIQAETDGTVGAIRSVSQTIQSLSEMATGLAGAVEQQSAATAEIARNVEHASAMTAAVADNIAQVAAAAGETGRMAGEVSDATDHLTTESRRIQAEVGDFLAAMRAI